jgi:hypothetical protein
MFFKVNENEYLICRKPQLSLSQFLDEIGIRKNTIGAKIFQKIYDELYSHNDDLDYIYKKYYSNEYDNFKQFLKKYKRYDDEIIQSIFKHIGDDVKVYAIDGRLSIDYSIESLLKEDLAWVLDVIKGY